MHDTAPKNWGSNLQKAQTFAPDWEQYVTSKVKNFRASLLSGMETFTEGTFTVPMAIGFIELLGMRVGAFRTVLMIGFTDSSKVMLPSFELLDNRAVGTIVLPSQSFGAALQFASSPTAHFRIGGDGRGNALANDVTLLERAMSSIEEPVASR